MSAPQYLEPITINYDKDEWMITKFGNKISKESKLEGAEKLAVRGKTIIESGAVLRGDLSAIRLGSSCIIGKNVTLQPPSQMEGSVNGGAYIPQDIGNYCVIEDDCMVEAARIGAYTHIEKGCTIGARSIISSCCVIAADTVIPVRSVIPPFSHVKNQTGTGQGLEISQLPYSFQYSIMRLCDLYYDNFVPQDE